MKKAGKNYPNPWKGLDSYQEGDRLYGRDDEVARYFNGIYNNLQTVIYGRSGIGKTSVLQAGIYPELRRNGFFPVPIRLGVPDGSASYTEMVLRRLDEEVESCGLSASTVAQPVSEDEPVLWSHCCRTKFCDAEGHVRIPVFVFDQFEEILNNKDTYQKTVDFLLEVYPMIENSREVPMSYLPYSNYRIVLILREDYLYYLEDLIDRFNLSELRYNRFRLTALDAEKARLVVRETMGARIRPQAGAVDPAQRRRQEEYIYDTIVSSAKNRDAMESIDTATLSMVGSQLCLFYESVDERSVQNLGGLIYDFYRYAVRNVSSSCVKYLESHLITSDGRRTSEDYNEIITSGKVQARELKQLERDHIIRILNDNTDNRRIEFCHDTITRLIKRGQTSFWRCARSFYGGIFRLTGHVSLSEYKTSLLAAVTIPLVVFALVYSFFDLLSARVPGIWILEELDDYMFSFSALLILASLMALLALKVRRLHVVGRTGLWALLPVAGLVMGFQRDAIRPYEYKVSRHFPSAFLKVFRRAFRPILGLKGRSRMSRVEYIAAFLTLLHVDFFFFLFMVIVSPEDSAGMEAVVFHCMGGAAIVNLVYFQMMLWQRFSGHWYWQVLSLLVIFDPALWLYGFASDKHLESYGRRRRNPSDV